jgi:hypothetical protein
MSECANYEYTNVRMYECTNHECTLDRPALFVVYWVQRRGIHNDNGGVHSDPVSARQKLTNLYGTQINADPR